MRIKLRERLVSAACAVAMLFSAVNSSFAFLLNASAEDSIAADTSGSTDSSSAVAESDKPLTQQSIELYPNGEESDEVITLEGMMPEGAEAEAVDVSAEHDGIAYDITILDGDEEYQPAEGEPILVEIADPAIPDSENIQLWHIRDDGEREQIFDFTAENGKITFYAEGFSVYEIVTDDGLVPINSADIGWNMLTDFDYFVENSEEGFFISWYNGGRFITNDYHYGLKNTAKRSGLIVTSDSTDNSNRDFKNSNCVYNEVIQNAENSGAVRYYFKKNGDKYIVYCYSGNDVKYVANHKDTGSFNSLKLVDSIDEASQYSVSKNGDYFIITDDNGFMWNYANQSNATYNGVGAYNGNSPDNSFILWYYIPPDRDPYNFDGKTYGLMNFTGGTHGYALVAGNDNVHTLVELVTHKSSVGGEKTLYVDEGSEISIWRFECVEEDKYKLSTSVNGSTKYLTVSGDALTVTNSADNAAAFKVTPDNNGKLQLFYDGKYVIFTASDDGLNSNNKFTLSSQSKSTTWLTLLDTATLEDTDYITYSANRISISDAVNGQKVIVYIRVWDEVNLKYDMYAVDYNGTLYPCYASGGKILWLGDGTDSLEWEFTEYYDPVTKEPNYYYELFNPYSDKYIAPQISSDQVLSDDTIGINLPGRRNNEFYSDIIAWDNTRYAYIGMKPNEEKTKLVPCAQSASIPFYFASREELNLSDKLHEVDTIDNNDYGITIKMQDFGSREEMSGFLGNNSFVALKTQPNLLSTNIGEDGYPVAKNGKSLKELYSSPNVVNHLFIKSIYNSSGYFEFDSCQNFATLCNPDGTLKTSVDHKNSDNSVTPTTDFTVYRELGTSDKEQKSTMQHGQFLPYNTIEPFRYASKNALNLYSSFANTENSSAGLLDETDPRKYERLYLIKDSNNKDIANYYNGMEIEASFVQTVSGLDAWGHDIIFEFTGDDDFWLYVDNELVIDLGGIHSALEGKVNFRTGEVYVNGTNTTLRDIFVKNYRTRGLSDEEINSKISEIFEDNGKGQFIFKDYTIHTMKIFYMERGAGASNLHMRFNLASVTPGHVSVTKKVSGDGASALDLDFLEYPFQIYYTVDEDGDGLIDDEEEKLLGNDEEHIHVTYQNSNQPVNYVKRYRPPGFTEEEAYENIYFINPTKSAEISFPDNTIGYRIVECAVDSSVYVKVTINGEEVPATQQKEIKGLISYSSDSVTAESRPTISFDNKVEDNVIKDLMITKKLLDENDQEITGDPATFNFRLHISSVEVDPDEIPLANMYRYYVLSPDKKLCRFDPDTGGFAETDLEYSRDAVKALIALTTEDELDDEAVENYNALHPEATIGSYGLIMDDVIFNTSGFGAISQIPSGYTICVPGLPVGTQFKVTEDVKTGYGLMGYERLFGDKTDSENNVTKIASYEVEEGHEDNVGRVIADQNPMMEVHNKRGYGLTVNKKWSDLDITTSHDSVYVAVYVDGELLEGSVKEIKTPSTSAYYFWEKLKDNRTSLEDYEIKEVSLTGDHLVVAEDGTVTGYDSIVPLDDGDGIRLNSTRTVAATPAGEQREGNFNYIVSYEQGSNEGSTRTDTITNTREGGLQIRLFKWNSSDPLKGGHFTLLDSDGNTVGNYSSDDEGTVTILYKFDKDKEYTLTQTSAPKGYVGLRKTVKFKVNSSDNSVSMYYNDGSEWGSEDADDLKWANWKPGENGILDFVDVYNKPFNLKIMKIDSEDPSLKLGSAHFALYKQANTSISGYVKNKDPMTGFEDMITVNGEVDVCGGDSGRVINPGSEGSVYFLTETEAPFNYTKLDEDIVFKISPIGIPTMITQNIGDLTETEDSFIYTLNVSNTKKDEDLKLLTVEKKVGGPFGNRNKDFDFTIEITGAGDGEPLVWSKNGEEQTPMPRTGGSFTMKHDDKIEIALPENVTVKVTEANEDYSTSFKLGNEDSHLGSSYTFEFTDSVELVVTNTLSGEVATGVSSTFARAFALLIIPAIPLGIIIYRRRRRYE